jgi:predicted HicB family RNase H-like nuclease
MQDYKGYSAKFSLDEEQGVFHGEVVGITDVVTFEGKTADELTKAFHDSVDDYLAFCEERGEKADKPYSGRFVLRMSPELHRAIALASKKADMSMNEWVVGTAEEALERSRSATANPAAQKWWTERLSSLGPSGLAAFFHRPTQDYDLALQYLMADAARPRIPTEVIRSSLISALDALSEGKESEKAAKHPPRRVR